MLKSAEASADLQGGHRVVGQPSQKVVARSLELGSLWHAETQASSLSSFLPLP